MAIKTYKPTTPSRRHMTSSGFEGVEKFKLGACGLFKNERVVVPEKIRHHNLVAGTGEKLAQAYVDMLKTLN